MKNNTAIILITLSIALFYSFTRTQYKELVVLRSTASEYREVLRNTSAVAELRDRLLITAESLPAAEVSRLGKILPDNIDTIRIALDLDNIASNYGISIRDIQTSTAVDADSDLPILPGDEKVYDTAVISFSFVSSYENFKRFLTDIEKSLRIMDIKSVSFQSTESDLYKYDVSFKTYWLR